MATMLVSFFLIPSAYSFDLSSASFEPHQIYFECTIVSDVSVSNLAQTSFSQVSKYSAIRADVLSQSELSVNVGGKVYKIASSHAKKVFVSTNHEQIEITTPDGNLSLDLKGKPLSRNGFLEI